MAEQTGESCDQSREVYPVRWRQIFAPGAHTALTRQSGFGVRRIHTSLHSFPKKGNRRLISLATLSVNVCVCVCILVPMKQVKTHNVIIRPEEGFAMFSREKLRRISSRTLSLLPTPSSSSWSSQVLLFSPSLLSLCFLSASQMQAQ